MQSKSAPLQLVASRTAIKKEDPQQLFPETMKTLFHKYQVHLVYVDSRPLLPKHLPSQRMELINGGVVCIEKHGRLRYLFHPRGSPMMILDAELAVDRYQNNQENSAATATQQVQGPLSAKALKMQHAYTIYIIYILLYFSNKDNYHHAGVGELLFTKLKGVSTESVVRREDLTRSRDRRVPVRKMPLHET